MSNLKEIRNRIASVNSTQQITSAMKMVSASKLKKAQDAILRLRPYDEKLFEIIFAISDSLKNDKTNIYSLERPAERVLIVLLASNRGLCGAFNTNVIRKAIQLTCEKYSSQLQRNNVDFYILGKRAEDMLKRRNFNIVKTRHDVFNQLSFENVAAIAEEIMSKFANGYYDRVDIVYNQFKNAGVQVLTDEQYLPLKIVIEKEEADPDKAKYETYVDFIFEPSKNLIINEVIPKLLRVHFYKAVLDSHASEHGARMTSMHKATDNAGELLKELSLEYNKARQAAITKEILEIVGGAEALKS